MTRKRRGKALFQTFPQFFKCLQAEIEEKKWEGAYITYSRCGRISALYEERAMLGGYVRQMGA